MRTTLTSFRLPQPRHSVFTHSNLESLTCLPSAASQGLSDPHDHVHTHHCSMAAPQCLQREECRRS
ncbi:hypothetical protein BC835DRAFT_1398799 [Cytidiella melzeri]|nr:hypothetical protein BC835DRAFT_1398799 [Cytidiella melzeri]